MKLKIEQKNEKEEKKEKKKMSAELVVQARRHAQKLRHSDSTRADIDNNNIIINITTIRQLMMNHRN
jgi:hypothetical protein